MELKEELKIKLIQLLNLEETNAKDILNDAPLFGEGLGLDSIDALEIIVLLDNQYGISVSNPDEGKKIFYSIDSLAAYIEENRG